MTNPKTQHELFAELYARAPVLVDALLEQKGWCSCLLRLTPHLQVHRSGTDLGQAIPAELAWEAEFGLIPDEPATSPEPG